MSTFEVARAALDIRNMCGGYFVGPQDPQYFWAGGQEFSNWDYNVAVKGSNNPVYPFGPVPNGGCGSGV
jgi:hypothetical protein